MKVQMKVGRKSAIKEFTVKVPELVDAIRRGYVKPFDLELVDQGKYKYAHNRFIPFRIVVDLEQKEIKFKLAKKLSKIDKFLNKGGKLR